MEEKQRLQRLLPLLKKNHINTLVQYNRTLKHFRAIVRNLSNKKLRIIDGKSDNKGVKWIEEHSQRRKIHQISLFFARKLIKLENYTLKIFPTLFMYNSSLCLVETPLWVFPRQNLLFPYLLACPQTPAQNQLRHRTQNRPQLLVGAERNQLSCGETLKPALQAA